MEVWPVEILTLRLEILTAPLARMPSAPRVRIPTGPPLDKTPSVSHDRRTVMEFLKGTPMDHLATAFDLRILMHGILDTLLRCATVVLLGLLPAPFLPIRISVGERRPDRCRRRKIHTVECSTAPSTIAPPMAVPPNKWPSTLSLPWVVARAADCLADPFPWNRIVSVARWLAVPLKWAELPTLPVLRT